MGGDSGHLLASHKHAQGSEPRRWLLRDSEASEEWGSVAERLAGGRQDAVGDVLAAMCGYNSRQADPSMSINRDGVWRFIDMLYFLFISCTARLTERDQLISNRFIIPPQEPMRFFFPSNLWTEISFI